ncbi:MAG: hypothetical protein M1819_003724 [Sarea resinae]|nr:MAG: hypothetical protein M1819_003724 [Sarea resinae]
MYTVCGVNSHGRNANCMSRKPAYPLNPPENFHTKTGVPQSFIGTHRYYYETRFMFAFFLITLFFAVCSIFTGILAMFSRLGGYVSGVFASIAAFFAVISAALMSAAYVAGRNHFHSNGQSAKVGTKLFAFAWTSFVLLFLSTILFFVTGGISHRSEQPTYTKKTGGKSFFSRKRSTRSRGSFIDNESQRRVVKDEYS